MESPPRSASRSPYMSRSAMVSRRRSKSPSKKDPSLQASSKPNTPMTSPLLGDAPSSSSSYLSRKAHRFSSLKKKKPSASLINKLFCNPSSSSEEKDEKDDGDDVENNTSAGCVSLALSEAVQGLKLDREHNVRDTIQTSITDAQSRVVEGCVACQSQPSLEDNKMVAVEGAGGDDGILEASDSSSGDRVKCADVSLIKSEDDDDEEEKQGEQVPVEKTVAFLSSPPPRQMTTPRGNGVELAYEEKFSTPNEVDDDDAFLPDDFQLGAPVTAPTPTPFKPDKGNFAGYSWQQVEDQIAQAVAKANSAFKQAPSPKRTPTTFTYEQVQARVAHAVQEAKAEYEKEMTSKIKQQVEKAMEEARLADSGPVFTMNQVQEKIAVAVKLAKEDWEESLNHATSYTEDEVQEQIRSALAQARKEWEAEQSKDDHHQEVPKALSVIEMQDQIEQALSKAQEEWNAAKEKEIEQVVSECKSQAEEALKQHSEQWKVEHAAEIQQLQGKHERKANELKDQTAMVKQLMKQHQSEMEAMEKRLASSVDSAVVQEMQDQLQSLKKERDELTARLDAKRKTEAEKSEMLIKEIETMREELVRQQEIAKAAQAAQLELQMEKEQQLETLHRLQDRLGTKSPLNSPSKLPPSSPVRDALRLEVDTLQGKLKNLREQLQTRAESPRKLSSLDALQEEMESLRKEKDDQIAVYEKEIEALRQEQSSHSSRYSEELDKLKGKLADMEKENERLRSEPNDNNESVETLKQELESLRQQKEEEITTLSEKLSSLEETLSAKEKELSKSRSPLRNGNQGESAIKAKHEAVSLRRELEQVRKQKDMELSTVQKELKFVQDKLLEKEKELTNARHATPSRRSGTPTSTPGRRSGTPGRSPGGVNRTPSRPASASRRDSVNLELFEREKEGLRQQIGVLEEEVSKLNRQHEKAMEELRRRSEQDLMDIKKEMEVRIEKHMAKERELKDSLATVDSADKEELLERIEQLEAEKKADRSGGLREVQKKEELLFRIADLERRENEIVNEHSAMLQEVRARSEAEIRRLQREIEKQRNESIEKERQLQLAITQTESFEKEELLQQIDKLEAQLENERNGNVLMKMKLSNAEKEAKAAEKELTDEIAHIREMYESEAAKLREELLELSAIEEAMQITSNERDAFEEEVKKLNSVLENERSSQHQKLDDIRKQNTEEVARMDAKCKETIESIEKEWKERMEAIQEELRVLKEEKDALQATKGLSPEDEKKLRDEVNELKCQLESEKKTFEETLEKLRQDQRKESEDMLAQLDLVEKEHQDRVRMLEKIAKEKDAIITALGSQLADATSKSKAAETLHKQNMAELELVTETATQAAEQLDVLKKELSDLREKHDKFVKDAAIEKEKACEDAREEMIQRAEVQFEQANGLYMKLKKQYDLCKKKVESLEGELKRTKDNLERLESSEVELKSEIAAAKASQAKIQAEAANKAREYRREMERLLKAAEGFEKRAQEAEASSRHAHKRVTVLTAEKEQLQKEHDEVKSVCEELMAMVEGQHHEC